MHGPFLILDTCALSHTLTEPATSLCHPVTQGSVKRYSVRKRTHQLILKFSGVPEHFPAGCFIYSPPRHFLSRPHSWGTKQHQGPRQPSENLSLFFFLQCYYLSWVPPPTLSPHCRLSMQVHTQWCECTKAQSHTPSSFCFSPEKLPGLQLRSSVPLVILSSLLSKPTKDGSKELRTRGATTHSVLCSAVPSCGPHAHNFAPSNP